MCCDAQSHLQVVEDFVVNEDRIVTCKWLSKEIGVHVNTAKQLLYSFASNKNNPDLLVTYFVSGTLKGSNEHHICLVKSTDLNEVKSKFSVISSEHVYSVQKANNAISSNELYLVESLAPTDISLSSIKPDEDIKEKTSKQPVKQPVASTTTQAKNNKNVEKNQTAATKEKPKSPLKNEKPSPVKKESPLKTRTSPRKKESTANNAKKGVASKGASIGTFFSKMQQNATATKPPVEPKPAKAEVEAKEDSPTKKVVPEAKLSKQTLTTNPKKRKKSKNNDKRKRKRIMLASDSESNDSDEEMEVDEPPLSPEPEPEPPVELPESDEEIIPPTPGVKGRKRVRKQIDKTFTDDEGFIITKKEYVYESCTDDEDTETPENTSEKEKAESKPESPKKAPKQASPNENKAPSKPAKKGRKPKVTSPQKQKQQSITSFFKKA